MAFGTLNKKRHKLGYALALSERYGYTSNDFTPCLRVIAWSLLATGCFLGLFCVSTATTCRYSSPYTITVIVLSEQFLHTLSKCVHDHHHHHYGRLSEQFLHNLSKCFLDDDEPFSEPFRIIYLRVVAATEPLVASLFCI